MVFVSMVAIQASAQESEILQTNIFSSKPTEKDVVKEIESNEAEYFVEVEDPNKGTIMVSQDNGATVGITILPATE